MPLVTAVVTISYWNSVLPEHVNDSPDFSSYMPILPDVEYSKLSTGFIIRHKSYKHEGVGKPNNPEVKEELPSVELFDDLSIHHSYSKLSKELNTYLYQVCQRYCSGMTVGDIELSPLLILAEANIEGGRVDTSETFSAIAHTSVYDFTSVEELRNFNVVRVLDNAKTWKAMSSEYSTRDRGALQCNPNYGASNIAYGPSERELLNSYISINGTPDYGKNKDATGNIFDVDEWISYSRTAYGDRFNVESLAMMFADEKRYVEIPGILQNFPYLQNEYHVYAIMAYNHWAGSGFMTMDRDIAYAGWKTVARADEYCLDISSPEAIEVLYSLCVQDIERARREGSNPVKCLDNKNARVVFDKLVNAGICKPWDYYFRHKYSAGGTWDQGVSACAYPLAQIYGVIQMNLLYSGY